MNICQEDPDGENANEILSEHKSEEEDYEQQ